MTAGAPRAGALRIPVGGSPPCPAVLPGTTPRTQAGISTVVRSPHASACVLGVVPGGLFEALGVGPHKVSERGRVADMAGRADVVAGLSYERMGRFGLGATSRMPQPGAPWGSEWVDVIRRAAGDGKRCEWGNPTSRGRRPGRYLMRSGVAPSCNNQVPPALMLRDAATRL